MESTATPKREKPQASGKGTKLSIGISSANRGRETPLSPKSAASAKPRASVMNKMATPKQSSINPKSSARNSIRETDKQSVTQSRASLKNGGSPKHVFVSNSIKKSIGSSAAGKLTGRSSFMDQSNHQASQPKLQELEQPPVPTSEKRIQEKPPFTPTKAENTTTTPAKIEQALAQSLNLVKQNTDDSAIPIANAPAPEVIMEAFQGYQRSPLSGKDSERMRGSVNEKDTS